MLSQFSRQVGILASNGLRSIGKPQWLAQTKRFTPLKRTFRSSSLSKVQLSSLYQTKRIRQIRNYCSKSKPLSWDTFRQDAAQLGEKISTLVSESEGHLDRVIADALVSDILKLRKAHPLRHDDLLSTVDLEEYAFSVEESGDTEPKSKDALVERYEMLLMLASESRDFKLVLELYAELKQRNIEISPLMLNVTMKSMLEAGDVSKGSFIFNEVDAASSKSGSQSIDAITLFFAMQTYVSLGDAENMSSIYSRLGKLVAGAKAVRGDVVQRVIGAYLAGLVQIGRPGHAMDMYEQIHGTNAEIVNTPIVHIALIEAYSDARRHQQVESLFEKLAASDIRIPYTSISRTIVSLLCMKKDKKAQAIYQALEQSGLASTASSWQQFVDTAASPTGLPKPPHCSENREPLARLREEPTVKRYEDAIAHFALAGDLVLAESLLNEYTSKHPSPTLKMVSSLFQGGARLGNSKYLPLVANFQSNAKLPPSLARSLIYFHIQRRNLPQATEAFYKISARYPGSVDSTMCESLLTLVLSNIPSSANSGSQTPHRAPSTQKTIQTSPEHIPHSTAQTSRLQMGIDLYYHMTSTFPDSTLTIDFFNSALSLFTKETHPKGVSDTLEEIRKRKLQPNAGTYTSLMYLYLRRPDYNMVIQTYSQLIQNDLVPDVNTISALAIALGESKALANSKSVLFLKEQLDQYNILPDSVFLEVLKRATIEAGNPNAFGVLMRFLVQKYQLGLTAGNYNSWLAALLQCDEITRALSLATTVLESARKKPNLLTLGFASQLALYVSKEGGSDVSEESVEKWIADPSASSKVLTSQQRSQFETDVKQWSKLFPEDAIPSL